MTLAEYRKRKDLTLEECAAQLGLKSKGHLSDIETGVRTPSLNVALRIEAWTGGKVKASEISDRTAAIAQRKPRRKSEAA